MKQIGMVEATSRFSEIARRVKESGQAVRIISGNEDVVDIVPVVGKPVRTRSKAEAVALLADLRRELPKMSAAEIKATIEEGRH